MRVLNNLFIWCAVIMRTSCEVVNNRELCSDSSSSSSSSSTDCSSSSSSKDCSSSSSTKSCSSSSSSSSDKSSCTSHECHDEKSCEDSKFHKKRHPTFMPTFNSILPTFGGTLPDTADCTAGIDMVFLLDRTGSMATTISNLFTSIELYAAKVIEVSSNDYRFGLVSVEGEPEVPGFTLRVPFQLSNKDQISAALSTIIATGGAGAPEPTDLALASIVEKTIGLGDWRPNINRIVVLMTDATPSGGDDTYVIGVDDVFAHSVAVEASVNRIRVFAIKVGFPNFEASKVLEDYAATTSGQYAESVDGTVSDAIITALDNLCKA